MDRHTAPNRPPHDHSPARCAGLGVAPAARRRGSVYAAVLGMLMVVTVVAMGALAVTRAQARATDLISDSGEARSYANSGLELARLWIAQDANWRVSRANGAWASNLALGQGNVTIEGQNPNGLMNNYYTDPVVITATGVRGVARQKAQVTLGANVVPLSSLNASVVAGSNITLSSTVVQGNQTLAGNAGISSSNGSSIWSKCEAAGSITGATYYCGTTSGVSARVLPNSATVFDYYLSIGTTINATSIPSRTIEGVVLSPARNPYTGVLNPRGVYIINCMGNDVTVRAARIVGTLVFINLPSKIVKIENSVHWAPAVANFPCVMVQGNATLSTQTPNLVEGSGRNFNPTGTPYPYPSGTSNSTTSDSYPSQIEGLIYISGNLTMDDHPTIAQLIVNGSITGSNLTLIVNYKDTAFQLAPPGFYSAVNMLPVASTWKRVVP